MDLYIEELTQYLDKNPKTDEEIAKQFLKEIYFNLPDGYLDFMMEHNGAEGEIGANSYLQLWKLEELFELNSGYEVNKYAPGFFIFASDGGGTAYAFNKDSGFIFQFELIGMLIDNDPFFCGKSFLEFLKYLYNYN